MRSKKGKSRDLLQDLTGWMGKTGPSKKKNGGGRQRTDRDSRRNGMEVEIKKRTRGNMWNEYER